MPQRKRTSKTLSPRARRKQTREQYLEALEARRDAKYEKAASKLSPEDRMWGDPPDEPRYSREEEFVSLYRMNMKPEEFADKEEGRRYRSWLNKLEKLPSGE
jgi:hypothetical protein